MYSFAEVFPDFHPGKALLGCGSITLQRVPGGAAGCAGVIPAALAPAPEQFFRAILFNEKA